MAIPYHLYEPVIGLEVHMQLQTNSKAYSSDPNKYGEAPNSLVSPLTLGHPGTLPYLNEAVIAMAIKLGLATNCEIRPVNEFARKNYFYADLPKGYQITQHTTPICNNGFVEIMNENEQLKKIGITRIHMEEDAGKSMHDQDIYDSLIDFNRCGVPLLEMVSEPDLRSAKEAYNYLTEIRKLVRYLDICDGNMEEGSLRCDANISVRKIGSEKFGTKVEVKNMNSIRNVQRAIEYEIKRQIDLLENGQTIHSETRSFDASNGTTFALRSKELANDYRYFPEPDLPPVIISKQIIESVRMEMPELPNNLVLRLINDFGLSNYDALQITENKQFAQYYLAITQHTTNYKVAANYLMGVVKSYLNQNAIEIGQFPITPERLAHLINLTDAGKISTTVAQQQLFAAMITHLDQSPAELAEKLNLLQESDVSLLSQLIDEVLLSMPEKVDAYKAGKIGLMGLFVGEVMKKSKGKADPKLTNQILQEKLK